MTNLGNSPVPKDGNSKIISCVLAAAISGYFMNYASLHGVNFEELGVSSEIVKSTLVGMVAGFFATLTPKNFVSSVRDTILFVRDALMSWRKAAEEGKE